MNHQRTDKQAILDCMAKIETFSTIDRRAKPLTVGEIEHASDAAFYPSVYGESLARIMDLQKTSYPQLKVPVILPFLADGILALGGTRSEGIFRVPGDGDCVAELKSRMDRGHYRLVSLSWKKEKKKGKRNLMVWRVERYRRPARGSFPFQTLAKRA